MKSNSGLVQVARALHPEPSGWVYAIGDRDGFRQAHWLDLGDGDWLDRLRDYATGQGGARLSISSYRTPRSHRSANVMRCAGVMVDSDGSRAWRFWSGSLSIVVASGGETNGRRHVHVLRLVEDLDPADASPYFRGAAEQLGGDPGFSAGVTATIRLPLDADDLLVFRPERVARASQLHRAPEPVPKPVTRSESRDRFISAAMAVDRRLAEVGAGESRNLSGYRLALDLWSHGLTEDETIEAGRRYVEAVEDAKVGDDPYELAEWKSQIKRRFRNGPAAVDPEFVAKVDAWETCWLADPSTSSSQKTLISAMAGRARSQGAELVTASRRQMALDARLSLPAVERALRGSKTRKPLLGRALRQDKRKRNGRKGAYRFQLVASPPSPPISIPNFPVACERIAPPPKSASESPVAPSPTVPENHDAWSWSAIGHGPRLVFDVLVFLGRAASVSELARHPSLSNHRTTIRRQLRLLEDAEIVRCLPDQSREVITDDLDALLGIAAEKTERPNAQGIVETWSERTHRQNEEDRRAYELALDPVERERKERARLQRVNGRRIAKQNKRRDCRAGRVRGAISEARTRPPRTLGQQSLRKG
ncbi:MAG: hypothetical protein R2725_05965 [Solirubrobacterales bacterium]